MVANERDTIDPLDDVCSTFVRHLFDISLTAADKLVIVVIFVKVALAGGKRSRKWMIPPGILIPYFPSRPGGLFGQVDGLRSSERSREFRQLPALCFASANADGGGERGATGGQQRLLSRGAQLPSQVS